MKNNVIRRGGLQTKQGFLFELSGGHPAIDFVNTIDMRPTCNSKELIPAFRDFCAWAEQAGILTREQHLTLIKNAKKQPSQAESARRGAVRMRECLFQIFSCVSDKKDVPAQVLQEWNQYVPRMIRHYELVSTRDGLMWKQQSSPIDFESILWPIIHTAVGLLTGDQSTRIRKCASDKCDWIFLDTSKRGNRRWCDMTVCGNRAKAQRFYSRKKAG